MAEKHEPRWGETIVNGMKWGAIGFLGIWALVSSGTLPAYAIYNAVHFGLKGAYIGGAVGTLVASIRELGNTLFPKPKPA